MGYGGHEVTDDTGPASCIGDTGTAARILQALRQQRQGRTVLIVSHRLATVMDADQILVLRHGQVTERGTHAQLLTSAPADGHASWYATQWQVQQLEASLESDEDPA